MESRSDTRAAGGDSTGTQQYTPPAIVAPARPAFSQNAAQQCMHSHDESWLEALIGEPSSRGRSAARDGRLRTRIAKRTGAALGNERGKNGFTASRTLGADRLTSCSGIAKISGGQLHSLSSSHINPPWAPPHPPPLPYTLQPAMSILQALGLTPSLTCQHPDVRNDVPSLARTFYPPCTTTRASSKLPMEVILEILEAAYYDDNLEPDDRLLANCALVCPAWSAPAQRLLFRHVALRSGAACKSFLRAIDRRTERGRELGDAVARLRITLDSNHPDMISHLSFARAVVICPNLYELDLSLYGRGAPGEQPEGTADESRICKVVPSFDAGTLALLRSGSRIRALKLANWTDNDEMTMQLLSDVWPTLTSVVLKGLPPNLKTEDPSLMPFKPSLSEVRLNFQARPKTDFVDWLLQNSTQSLRSLELEREPSPELLSHLLEQYGSCLESLSIPTCATATGAASIHTCERLREFKVENPVPSPLAFKQLPAGVQHLAFSVSRDTPLHVMVNSVKELNNLAAVTVQYWDEGDKHPLLPSLKIACAMNGVAFRSTRNVQRFRAMVRGDPIPITTFPRFKEPANLRTMLYISVNTADTLRAPRHNRTQSDGDVSTDCETELIPMGSQDDLALLGDVPQSKFRIALPDATSCA